MLPDFRPWLFLAVVLTGCRQPPSASHPDRRRIGSRLRHYRDGTVATRAIDEGLQGLRGHYMGLDAQAIGWPLHGQRKHQIRDGIVLNAFQPT